MIQRVSHIVPQMTCIDIARNVMLHLLLRLSNHPVLCQNYEGKEEGEIEQTKERKKEKGWMKERRTSEAERI